MQNESSHLNGRIKVTTLPHEMRMSHWVYAPRVEDVLSGTILLDLADGLWDLVRVNESDSEITLVMRKYPGSSPEVLLAMNPDKPGFSLNGNSLTAPELVAALDSYK
jgi:hypothetical protein